MIFCGCDSFLDVKSDATLVVPKTLEDAQALLDNTLHMNERAVPARGVDAGEDYFFSESVYSGLPEHSRRFYVWDYPEDVGTGNDWSSGYVPIFQANLVLELLGQIERKEGNGLAWDNVKGSAHFYRAFYFFKLLGVFAHAFDELASETDHGIALRLDTDFNKLSVRATVRECIDQIIKDLLESIDYLPDFPQHVTRPSKGAAYALFSNLHHYMRDYNMSLHYADKALSFNSDLIDLNGDEHLLNLNTNTTPFIKYNKETIFYAELGNNVVWSANRSLIDSNFYKSFTTHDLRRQAYFREVADGFLFKGDLTGANARRFGGLSTSETILNKAESLAKLNRVDEAIRTLNSLLVKRLIAGSPLLDSKEFNKDTALEVIRLERKKELMVRGIYFMDLKRYNKEGANIYKVRYEGDIEHKLEPNSSKYALPIPQDVIMITGMPQN